MNLYSMFGAVLTGLGSKLEFGDLSETMLEIESCLHNNGEREFTVYNEYHCYSLVLDNNSITFWDNGKKVIKVLRQTKYRWGIE